MFKKIIKAVISGLVSFLAKSSLGKFIFREILQAAMSESHAINTGGNTYFFSIANPLLRLRAETFLTKEPETLEWIDRMNDDSVLWDIGANVGIYSIYAAVSKRANVIAFEPSIFNLEFLARNINLNEVADRVSIVPLPLSNKTQLNEMRITSLDWGGALSTFGETYDGNGDAINQIFGYTTAGMTADSAKEFFSLPQPDFIKLDVDGIEALVLAGGEKVLSKAWSVLVEVNDDFDSQAKTCEALLKKHGFMLKEKRQSDFEIRTNRSTHMTFNQIWDRQRQK